jgi:hypothetical protein
MINTQNLVKNYWLRLRRDFLPDINNWLKLAFILAFDFWINAWLYKMGVVKTRNITEYGGISRNMAEYHGISRNIPEYHGIWRNNTEYHDISPEYTGTSQYFPMVAMQLFINMDV